MMQDPLKVPRSLVISVGREMNGEGRSEILGAASGDEEGCFHDPIAPGEVS